LSLPQHSLLSPSASRFLSPVFPVLLEKEKNKITSRKHFIRIENKPEKKKPFFLKVSTHQGLEDREKEKRIKLYKCRMTCLPPMLSLCPCPESQDRPKS